MKVEWKDIDNFTQEIFLDEYRIGKVRMIFSSQKWVVEPNFGYDDFFFDPKKQHDSAYKAGKVLADLHCRTFYLHDYAGWEDARVAEGEELYDEDEYDPSWFKP